MSMPSPAAGAPQARARLDQATADLDPPLAVLDLDALDANADDLVRRAGGTPIRVASKSVRSRAVLRRVLARPGFAGVLGYSLAEAVWLAAGSDPVSTDVVVGYPSVDRSALRRLLEDEAAAARVTLMVDSVDHLDVVDSVVPAGRRPGVRVCLDLDASLRAAGGRLHVGVRRSPLHEPADVEALARAVVSRPGFALVGLMAYEAQIAGVQDAPAGRPVRGLAVRGMQARSGRELAARRAAAVAAVRAVAPLEFVNGGGTGSVERTSAEAAVTEVAAGSGLYCPVLFDGYRAFRPGRRPSSRCRSPAGRHPGSSRWPAAAGAPRARPAPTGCRSPRIRPGCGSSAPRAPGRCRRRCAARAPRAWAWATASGSGTPRPGRSASTSTPCTCCRATG